MRRFLLAGMIAFPGAALHAQTAPDIAPTASFWPRTLWPLGLLLAAGTAIQLVAAAIKRKKRGTVRGHTTRPTGSTSGPKTWQDAIAERLAQKQGGRGSETAQVNNGGAGPDLTPALLRRLEWKRFEQVVALYFEATGVRAECTCIGPDGGVDVKLFRPDHARPFSYIQCKAWGAEKVPVTKVREFLGVMTSDKITEGIFITTSDFWPDARAFAEANGIAALTTTDFVEKFQALPPETRTRILETVTRGDYTTPTCPQCDSKMVWKPRASFWACPKFPQCRSKPIWPRTV